MQEKKPLNIYQRLNRVREQVAYIQKDSTVQGYKAVTHDQVTAKIRPSLIKHGIATTQTLIESTFEPTGTQTSSGTPINIYSGKYIVSFVNIDLPDDSISVTVEAQAMDHGDKASGKAMSYAMKYALLKTFNLETGENEESRQDQFQRKDEQSELAKEKQLQHVKMLIEKTGSDQDKILGYYKASDLSDMNQTQLADLSLTLNKKLKDQENENN